MKSIIVAYDKKYGIGANNDLLWKRDLPSDLRRFKELTLGQAVIMGRHTYESIGRPLPGRQNIMISHQAHTIDGVTTVHSLGEAYDRVDADKETFVLGGATVYNEALDSVDRLYVTEVKAEFPEATVFFPAINQATWIETERETHTADERNKYDYSFVTYLRR